MIKVGEYASLTGQEASFGQMSHHGTELAMDELNARGGVIDLDAGHNSSNGAAAPGSRPKRNWRSALQDASRSGCAAGVPTGLGVQARQRRFPALARRFVNVNGVEMGRGIL